MSFSNTSNEFSFRRQANFLNAMTMGALNATVDYATSHGIELSKELEEQVSSVRFENWEMEFFYLFKSNHLFLFPLNVLKAANLNTLKPSTGLSNWLRRARNRMQQDESTAEDNIKRALDPITAAAREGAPSSVRMLLGNEEMEFFFFYRPSILSPSPDRLPTSCKLLQRLCGRTCRRRCAWKYRPW